MEGWKIMKRHPIVRQCLALGIIFLFLGIAVQPITSINSAQINELESINKVNNFYHEEDCNCEDVTTQDIAEVNRLLNKTEITIKNILSTYGFIPDIKLKCNQLLTILDTHGNHGPICQLLGWLCIVAFFIFTFFEDMAYVFDAMGILPILADIYRRIGTSVEKTLFLPAAYIGVYLKCDWTLYPEMSLVPNS